MVLGFHGFPVGEDGASVKSRLIILTVELLMKIVKPDIGFL